MINLEILYEDNGGDLIVATSHVQGKTYITEDGTRIMYLGTDNNSLKFKIVKTSPLETGVKLSEFENPKTALPMFWKLLNKDIVYDNTD